MLIKYYQSLNKCKFGSKSFPYMQKYVVPLKAFLTYFGFWLLMCFIDRLIFIASFFNKVDWSDFAIIFRIYYQGLALDLSVTAYICVLPFLVSNIFSFSNRIFKYRFLKIYTFVVLVLFYLITFINLNIYREWGDKISKRAIDAIFEDAFGAFASAGSGPIILPILFLVITIGLCYLLFLYLLKFVRHQPIQLIWVQVIQFILFSFLLFSFIRGGYGKAPINQSRAYFSPISFYNHAAVSTQWSLLREYFTRNQKMRSPYNYFEDSNRAKDLLKPVFYSNPDSSMKILTTDRPNIVLIVLESFVADLIKSMGGQSGVTPHFERLIKRGVLFDQVYAASDRSDKGLIGVFSGFPAQGPESIIKYIDKHEHLPGITQELHQGGYHNSFYHGGQSEFYNMKSYMLTHGVERVVDNYNFNPLTSRTAWGVYDHIVFNKMLEDLNKENQPFFSSIFTLVNHEPFELEGKYKFGRNSNVNKFKSTAYYTDQSINDFIKKAEKEKWYKNTLFIFIADHGHRLPSEKWDISHPNRFHIPMLFYGEVIKPEYRGLKVSNIGNQTDLAATLLNQVNLSVQRYPWSRDLLNSTTSSIAFYNSKDAFGVINSRQMLSYDRVGNLVNFIGNKKYPFAQNDSLVHLAKAYYQLVYEDFMKY